ncbi:MAG: hypothetical protein V4710_19665 [Verrucomicrobiota bacterium]
MTKPHEVLRSEEALTIIDIAQMLRTGLQEREILEDVRRRGLVEALNDSSQGYVQGASPALLRELKNYDYVLTDGERQNYYARMSARMEQPRQAQSSLQYRDTADPHAAERQRLLELQRQSLAIAERTRREEANRVAKMDAETAADRRLRERKNDRSNESTFIRSATSGDVYVAPVYVVPRNRYPNLPRSTGAPVTR